MEKKFFKLLMMLSVLIYTVCFMSMFYVSAEEIFDGTEGADTVTAYDENKTLTGQIWDFVVDNKESVITCAGDLLIFSIALAIRRKTVKSTSAIATNVTGIQNATTNINGSQMAVINAVNEMIDGYTRMGETYKMYGGLEGDRDKYVAASLAVNTAVLEILTTVYQNSRNLPQGVKDVVLLKYANCMKTVESDDGLKAVVQSVRAAIGADAPGNGGTKNENTGIDQA